MQARNLMIASLLAALLPACSSVPVAPATTSQQFFEGLGALCGARFQGVMSFPVDPKHDFAGKTLQATFASCNDDEVRVPFQVGDDRSRTWIFRRVDAGLLFKHDHRHPDGTPDEITMYGGFAAPGGTARSQSFPADAETAKLIPAAATNVWTVSLDPAGEALTYHLERDGKPRFTAILKRVPAARN